MHAKELDDYDNLTRIKNGTVFFFSLLFLHFLPPSLDCSIWRVTLFEIGYLGKLIEEMYRFIKCIAQLSRLLINFSMSFLILFAIVK